MNTSESRKRPTLLQYILCLSFILIVMGIVFFAARSFHQEDDPQEDRERLIIATSTVALDQYAPGVEYPETASGWVVSENPDGTITASSPNLGSPVFVMLVENPDATRDGDRFIPYFVKAGTETYLDMSDLYDPSKQPEIVPSQPLDDSDELVIESIQGLLSDWFLPENISVRSFSGRTEISVSDEELTEEATSALSSGGSPASWPDLLAFIEGISFPLLSETDGTLLYVKDTSGETIYLTIFNGSVLYDLFDGSAPVVYNAPTISLSEFNQITTGMTYDEVVALIGSSGQLLSETDLGLGSEYVSAMWMWEGEGSLGANANVMFQGGKVTSKAQYGLE